MARDKKKGAAKNRRETGKASRKARQKHVQWSGGDLESQLHQLNLCIKDMSGDGNCLFRALSDQYYGSDSEYRSIRREVCQYLRENEETYKYFVEDDQSFEHHVECMEQNGTYGGNMELAAFARLKQVDIKVYQPDMIYVIQAIEDYNGDDTVKRKTLHIAYHSWEHYSSIRNINGPVTGLPEIEEPRLEDQPAREQEDSDDNDDELDSKEKVVLSACPETSIRRIRRLLRKHKGDPDKVINVLYEEAAVAEEKEGPQIIDVSSKQEPVESAEPTESTEPTEPSSMAESPSKQEALESSAADMNGTHGSENQDTAPCVSSSPTNTSDDIQVESTVNTGSDTELPVSKKKPKRVSAQERKRLAKLKQKENQRAKKKAAAAVSEVNTAVTQAMKEMYI